MSEQRSFGGRLVRLAIWFAVVAGVIAIGVWWAAKPATPDAFYVSTTNAIPAPGALLKAEPFSRTVPAGMVGWRILFSTTRADNSPAIDSAIVLAPVAALKAPLPVIAWAHGTTGIAPGCAPSVMSKPFANVPAMDRIAGENWAFVATDYVGLGTNGGHAYLVGDDAARNVLDSVRAARMLPELRLDNRVVVWGHSQGGNSALWTGIAAPAYAPDVSVVGVAALAPATDLVGLIRAAQTTMFGKIVSSYVAHAYGDFYDDVDAGAAIKSGARLVAADLASRCVGGWETLVSALETAALPADGVFASDPTSGTFGKHLLENIPAGPIAAPVLIGQGAVDDLVLPDVQFGYVKSRCAAGQPIDLRVYDGRDHISLVALDSPLSPALVDWSRDRFAGKPATDTCATLSSEPD